MESRDDAGEDGGRKANPAAGDSLSDGGGSGSASAISRAAKASSSRVSRCSASCTHAAPSSWGVESPTVLARGFGEPPGPRDASPTLPARRLAAHAWNDAIDSAEPVDDGDAQTSRGERQGW